MADYNGDLKLLAHKIDAQSKKIDKIDEKIDPVCDMVIRHDERIQTNKDNITGLRKRFDVWSGGNSLGLLATAALAYLRGG